MKFTFGSIALCLATTLSGQNLVPNGSFEYFTECPHYVGEINYAQDWFKGGIASPDLYNVCDASDTVGVPNNVAGHQFASTGVGYCGMGTYSNGGVGYGVHEIIGTRLLEPLVPGHNYSASLKVSWTTGGLPDITIRPRFASNNMGLLCTMDSLSGESDWYPWRNFAHVYSNEIISDSVAWTTISGHFIADSAYRFLWVGNFFDDAHTDVAVADASSMDQFSYYYVDDVCLSSNPADCGAVGFSNTHALWASPVATWDPLSAALLIDHWPKEGICEVVVTDELGRELLRNSTFIGHGRTELWRTPQLNGAGFIVLRIRNERETRCFKLITSH